MFGNLRQKFDDVRTMRVLFPTAEELAQRDGQDRPGAEHLLLAALDLPDGTATEVLERLGLSREDVRAAISAQHDDALRSLGVEARLDPDDLPAPEPGRGAYHSTGSAQRLFRAAADHARADGSGLRSAWFIVAATEFDRGSVARAIDRLPVDRAHLAATAREVLEPAS